MLLVLLLLFFFRNYASISLTLLSYLSHLDYPGFFFTAKETVQEQKKESHTQKILLLTAPTCVCGVYSRFILSEPFLLSIPRERRSKEGRSMPFKRNVKKQSTDRSRGAERLKKRWKKNTNLDGAGHLKIPLRRRCLSGPT